MANGYPIDQRGNTGSVGDDTPTEHAAWTLQLQAAGLPGSPIEKQTAMLTIDHGNDRDYISDKGDEVWNVIEGNGIKNVLIMGALHTCSACRALVALGSPCRLLSSLSAQGFRLSPPLLLRRALLWAGVHTNMCVLGRPFGLRQMARLGKNTALVRDMTDTSAIPRPPPHSGLDAHLSLHASRFVFATQNLNCLRA